ncbi:hypothetical protein KJ980_07450 [Patescibacteria group bacterium]|nr:hypothetical protein [Patescibacteria group bacterium]MBU4017139.1 hypothetical protein [Patescibacteria group bacterium]MBU4099456.1 hypothetical protein [Patescibacteria group bacterium]
MKQKMANDTFVTKIDLNKALSNHPTKDDLKKALANHPTKDDLIRTLNKCSMKFDLKDTEIRLDEKARQYRDEILTKMDQIVGELAQIREDRLFEKHEKREFQEQIGNHEKRIKKLEKQNN